jgi:ERCC4-type nuclease
MSKPFVLRADYREDRGACVITKIKEVRALGQVVDPTCYEFISEVLTTGDYVIQAGSRVLIIERKTWADLAASISDGRIFENHKKMLDAAAKGCRIMYLIEGRAPSPDIAQIKVGHIPIGNMQAKLDHFAMRDNCIIEYTRDGAHTAKRLLELGKHMASLAEADRAIMREQKDVPIDEVSSTSEAKSASGSADSPPDVNAIVKKDHVKPIDQVQLEMLTCVGGCGPITARKILLSTSFVRALMLQDLPTGLPERVMTELKALAAGERLVIYRSMLECIKGVSPTIAGLIATECPLKDMCNEVINTPDVLAKKIGNIKMRERRLGDALSKRIVDHLRQGLTLAETQPSAPTVPAIDTQNTEFLAMHGMTQQPPTALPTTTHISFEEQVAQLTH